MTSPAWAVVVVMKQVELRETCGRAVIEHDAVIVQHYAVSGFADRKLGEVVRVDAIEELGRIGALHFNLAQRGYVRNPNAGAHQLHFGDVG